MSKLFKRKSRLTIYTPGSTFFSVKTSDVVIVENLRVQFAIEKTLDKRPNTARITVSNMSEQTRNAVAITGNHVVLEVGYGDNGDLHRIFAGDVYFAESLQKGTEWETLIEFGNGQRAFKHSRFSQSFKSGVTHLNVVKAMSANMGLKVPTNVTEVAAFQKQFAGGYTARGQTQAQMSKVLKSTGYDWSMQDNELQILKKDTGVRSDEALEINQNNGMIGSPSFGSAPKKGKAPTVTVLSLMYPQIIPGRKVLIDSIQIYGTYKAVRVDHNGDTHRKDWFTKVEAISL